MTETIDYFRLLPQVFKKIGYGFALASALFLILFATKAFIIDKEAAKSIIQSGFLLSMLLIALSKNKIEDELTLKIRLKAFTFAFISGVSTVIINPFINLLFDESFISDLEAPMLLITMFIMYFTMVFFLRDR